MNMPTTRASGNRKRMASEIGSLSPENNNHAEVKQPRPPSPFIRKKLDDAKASDTIYTPVSEQGEVVQWMGACHSDLIEAGRALEARGYTTLTSIAFLTEDEIEKYVQDASRRCQLVTAVRRLRHELFRM